MQMVLEHTGGVWQAAHPKWPAQAGLNSLGTPYLSHRERSVIWLVSADVIAAAAGQDKGAPTESPSLKKILVASSSLSASPRSTTSPSSEQEESTAIGGEWSGWRRRRPC